MRRRRHSTNDLFEIFPDLPWARRRTAGDRREHVLQQVELVRERGRLSILRPRAATERVRANVAGFWRRA